jgi:saccharopine dehydrogenase-like NADP-dependent oxidoreductase
MKTIVLGCGLVGRPMAVDLATEPGFEITVVDRNRAALEALARDHSDIATAERDLADPREVAAVIADHDLVINAVPGFMGFQTLEAIIDAGKDVVDIAFYPESPFDLDELARDRGVTAIVDCGVSPGLSNLLIGHVHKLLDRTESILIYVGGLPEIRHWPFEYRAVFSPMDVIAEYTRPARFVEHGRLVTHPALSDPELIDFPGVGTLEAFNTDGLRTLADTIDAPNMKEKTLRYPGHIEKMVFLREAGFFGEEPVEVGGRPIRPVDLTAELLFPQWQLEDGEVDITVLRIIIEGEEGGAIRRFVFNLIDRGDPASNTHSMARTTGYTATMAARLVANGLYDRKGISPPELLGRCDECVEFVIQGLAERGIVIDESDTAGGGAGPTIGGRAFVAPTPQKDVACRRNAGRHEI